MFKVSTPSHEGTISVSKWLKHYVLLDSSEMERLISHVRPLYFFDVSTLTALEKIALPEEQFLSSYHAYIVALRAGQPLEKLPRELSSALSVTPEALYVHEVQPGRYMAKPLKPLVQLQPHRFFHSKIAKTIHSQVMGPDSISWGLQIAYPQIFFDEGNYSKVHNTPDFPNTSLFTHIAKWLRLHTVPTTFVFEDQKITTPLRLGKECFSWIANHPQLQKQGLAVHVY
jgi:hypothetical protein